MQNLTLRAFTDDDVAVFTEWLNKDYILKWYEDPADWLEEINGRGGAFSWIHHFIVMDGETPIGFCQYYDCFDAAGMEDWYDANERGDAYSIDYLIGHEAYLGKGYGKAVVKLITDTVRRNTPAKRIIVQPDKDNQPSNHVLLANGYLFDEQKDYYCKHLRQSDAK